MTSDVAIDERLAYAIEHRRQLEIRYVLGPQSRGLRVVNPHVVFTASTGALTLHAVQVGGLLVDGPGRTGMAVVRPVTGVGHQAARQHVRDR